MAVQELQAVEAHQWCPSGSVLDGIPGEICAFLAEDDGRSWGYAGGPGATMGFGSASGDIFLLPGQWIVRLSDGSVVVEDEKPRSAARFDLKAKRAKLRRLHAELAKARS